jgi:hypothetical protein
VKAVIHHDGCELAATLRSGDLKVGSFVGIWSGDTVTSDDLPGVEFETVVGIRGPRRRDHRGASVTLSIVSDQPEVDTFGIDVANAVAGARDIQTAGKEAGLSDAVIAALVVAAVIRVSVEGIREDLQDLRQAVQP